MMGQRRRHQYFCCISVLISVLIKCNGAYAFVASPLSPASGSSVEHLSSSSNIDFRVRRTSTWDDVILRTCTTNRGALFLAQSSARPTRPLSNDPRVEPRTTHIVTVDLPLGIVLEEMDSDPSHGVAIIGISEGYAARYNAAIYSTIKSQGNTIDCHSDFICVRDKVMSVNGTPCHDKSFDYVIDLISSAESNTVALELGRIRDSTVLNYYDGICISAKPGESYGFLAGKLGIDIQYACRSGNCQTCARWMEFPDKERDLSSDHGGKRNLYERTIFHCVGKVPRDYQWLHVLGNTVEMSENAVRG